MAIEFYIFITGLERKREIRRDDILLKRHEKDIIMNSYKLVSFNVVVVNTYKRCHITIKHTKLMLFKRDELRALDFQLTTTSAF